MSQLGLRFDVQPSQYEEPEPLADQDVRHYVSQLAWNKAWDVARATKNGWILGADTAGDLTDWRSTNLLTAPMRNEC